MNPTLTNVLTIARREFTVRARTRSYRVGTVVVVLGVLLFAFLPVLGRCSGRRGQEDRPVCQRNRPYPDPQATFTALLNATPGQTRRLRTLGHLQDRAGALTSPVPAMA